MEHPLADPVVKGAAESVWATRSGTAPSPEVKPFFDEATSTLTYVVRDPASRACAVIDSVLSYDAASGRTEDGPARAVAEFVRAKGLTVLWLLETHIHADHLSAAPFLQAALGGDLAIGGRIAEVQDGFGRIFNTGPDMPRDGRQFDRLFADGDTFRVGALEATVLEVPGHTPACVAYLIGDVLFPGDTLFMPDVGTARCDFPGGDAAQLYRSIGRLLALPDETRVFVCHDYKAPGRDRFAWETTIGDQRRHNIHVGASVGEAEFVAMRRARDATLPIPKLMLPSVQVNMRGGRLPEPEANGVRYLKIPVDAL